MLGLSSQRRLNLAVYDYEMLRAMGGEMLEVRDGYARATLNLSPKVMQPTGVFHAGAIVTLADEAASAAIHGKSGPLDPDDLSGNSFPYSIQLSVNLLSNDPVGPITAEATVTKRGRVTVVDTVVTSHDQRTCALMRSAHLMVDASKVGPHKKLNRG